MSPKPIRVKRSAETVPERHFRQVGTAVSACGDFHENGASGESFPPWQFDGMHDAGDPGRHTTVIKRVNFFRLNPHLKSGEIIQVDLRDVPRTGIHTAVYVRIIEHKKSTNCANATFKPALTTDNGTFYCEIAGYAARRNEIVQAVRNDSRFQIEDKKVLLGRKLNTDLVESLVKIARLAGEIDRPNGLRRIEPATQNKVRQKITGTGRKSSKTAKDKPSLTPKAADCLSRRPRSNSLQRPKTPYANFSS